MGSSLERKESRFFTKAVGLVEISFFNLLGEVISISFDLLSTDSLLIAVLLWLNIDASITPVPTREWEREREKESEWVRENVCERENKRERVCVWE